MIEIFATSVTEEAESAAIITMLQQQLPGCAINFDLKDCDKILRVKGDDFCITRIIELLQRQGFFCSLLK